MDNETLLGKVCIITGANSGIGRATTQLLLHKGAHVIMVVRNIDKGRLVFDELKNQIGINSLDLMLCDFSSQTSIRNFVNDFQAKYSHLDILINNHGAIFPKKELTNDGIERTFAVNYLSFFLLTNLLKDTFTTKRATIINVSSGAYAATRKWSLDDYNFEERKFSSFKAYSESKLYDIMFTYYLAEKLVATKITVNCYSPGFTRTNFGKESLLMKTIMTLFSPLGRSPLKSAQTAHLLASSKIAENITGKYFENMKQKETSPLTKNRYLQKELWDSSLELTGRTIG